MVLCVKLYRPAGQISIVHCSKCERSFHIHIVSLKTACYTVPLLLHTQEFTSVCCVYCVQDLSRWQSSKTGRGPLEEGWRDQHNPIMCSYKRVYCSFEVYGFQTRTEEFIHRVRFNFVFPTCLVYEQHMLGLD